MSSSSHVSVRVRPMLALAAALIPFRPFRALAADPTPTPATLDAPLTLIVGGLDERGAPGEDVNSDVFKLVRVDTAAATVRVVSVPRDLYVQVPRFGYDKITRAYDYGHKADDGSFKGGASAMRDTVSANFGLDVDGVVMTTFTGFPDIVDAFGGVDVENPYDVYDGEYPTIDYGYKEVYFPAGPLHLAGEQALEFSRTRHQDGDDARVMRQELVIRALLERARTEDGDQLAQLMWKHRKSIRTDLPKSVQLALALAAPRFINDGVQFTTLSDYIYPDTAPDGAWIYSGDWSQIPGFVQGFLAS